MIGTLSELVSSVTRRCPQVRGLTRTARALNRAFLRLGVTPLRVAKMRDGTSIRVDLRSHTELYSFYVGVYDPKWISVCKLLYDPDTVFVDVGANIGFFSIAMGQFIRSHGRSGKVLAFEAHPQNCSRLNENISLNHLESIVACHHVALSSCPGNIIIVMREDFAAGSATGNASVALGPEFDRGFETVEVRAEPLDKLISGLIRPGERIGFMKVDIEGHEDQFLVGATETVRAHEPILLLEVNKTCLRTGGLAGDDAILNRLPAGYRTFRMGAERFEEIASLAECNSLENIVSFPQSQANLIPTLARVKARGIIRR